MSEFGGLRKHENNQHALVPGPRRQNVAAQGADELKTVTYAIPCTVEERRIFLIFFLIQDLGLDPPEVPIDPGL